MNLTATLILTLAAGVSVEATTLDGVNVSGELESLTPQTATLQVDGEDQKLPVADLHQLRLGKAATSPSASLEVRLKDGSRLAADKAVLDGRSLKVSSTVLGEIELPKALLASVRLARKDRKVQSSWEELSQRKTRDDLVVIRKGDALDHVGGVVSGIDDEAVRLLLDGSPVPIPRVRVFGIVFASAEPSAEKAIGRVDLADGSVLSISSIRLADTGFEIAMTVGPAVVIAPADVRGIDFSLGKIQYLSDAEPTTVAYPTDHKYFLIDVWRYRQGENSHGDPLQLGGHRYDRGLWIHSGTTLTYRLGRAYRRLRGVAGIDEGIGEGCRPSVGVVIRGDGEELFTATIARGENVRDLDLDVSGVRELEIKVTSTDPDGICEHLGLGDVRVIK